MLGVPSDSCEASATARRAMGFELFQRFDAGEAQARTGGQQNGFEIVDHHRIGEQQDFFNHNVVNSMAGWEESLFSPSGAGRRVLFAPCMSVGVF